MKALERARLWLRANVFRARYEREMREEMAAHLERATDLMIARGMSPEEARREARLGFGNLAYLETEARESRGTLWLDALADDARYGMRQLFRAPLFTMIASVSVAIGIIVAVGAFTLFNSVMLKPLPVRDADGIYRVFTSDYDGRSEPYGSSSYADYQDFARSGAFRELAASASEAVAVSLSDADPRSEFVSFVSDNYFTALGLGLARGRILSGGVTPEIVITWPYWQREFGGSASALGSTIRLNGTPFTIVGVAPQSFRGVGMGPPLVGWAPAALLPATLSKREALVERGHRGFTVFGRLREGETLTTAASRLNGVARGLAEQDASSWRDAQGEPRLVTVLSQKDAQLPPGSRGQLLLALAAAALLVLFVVLLACTNVAALLVGRAVGRQHEIAVRLTLGATRARLIRQLLTESMLLGLIGGAVSLTGLIWAVRIVGRRIAFADVLDLRPDWRVVVVALLISMACALIFGLVPALQSLRVDVRSGLTGTAASPRRNRLRGALIALQVAASCVLIVLAFSAVRGVRAYMAIDPGIELDGLVALEIDREMFGSDSVRAATYMNGVRDFIAGLPGVQSASNAAMLPLGDGRSETTLAIPGQTLDPDETVDVNTVGSSYFSTVQLSAIRGRVFQPTDTRTSPHVAVVNRAFLDKYGQGRFGDVVTISGDERVRIVGVVPDISYRNPREGQGPLIYVVSEQLPWDASRQRFLMRVAPGSEAAVAAGLRERIRAGFPGVVIPMIETMHERTARQTAPHRIGGNVALGIGGLELALAAVGLYGLLMFALMARTREIGVRLALGASAIDATWAVMRDGLRYVAFGAIGGMVIAIPAAIVAQNALPGARATDPLPFAAALGAVLLANAVAAYMPVRKAGRVDPASALRHE